jgi:hypothetical protein
VKKKDEDEPVIGLDRLGYPIIDPAPDKPPTWEDTPAAQALFKGGVWGAVAGLAGALYKYPVSAFNYSPLGLFEGDIALALMLWIAAGYVLGALLGWLSFKVTGKDMVPRPYNIWRR